jgi:hypothetical protein
MITAVLIWRAVNGGDLAQRAWESDVSVRAVEFSKATLAGSITMHVTVTAERDDARVVRLEIMLPVGVGVVAMPPGCRSSPAPLMSLAARVTCTLGDLHQRDVRTISVTTTDRPGARRPLRFAAFAFSDTPDPQPGNNFAERDAR